MLLFYIHKDNKVSLVLGTMHNLPFALIPEHIKQFLFQAKTLVIENQNSLSITKQILIKAGILCSETDIDWTKELTTEQKEILALHTQHFFARKQVNVEISELTLTGAYEVLSFEYDSMGEGMDYQLIEHFQNESKKILGLESLLDIKEYLANGEGQPITIALVQDAIQRIIDHSLTIEQKAQKEKLLKVLEDYLFEKGCFLEALQEPDDEEVILRNRNWLPRLEKYHQEEEGVVLFSVGFAHIRDLLKLLSKAGYKITKASGSLAGENLTDGSQNMSWSEQLLHEMRSENEHTETSSVSSGNILYYYDEHYLKGLKDITKVQDEKERNYPLNLS